MTKASTLIFTDMDGTLLDHHTYSFDAAKPTLEALKSKNIPVIPTTSKTFAEMVCLRKDIGLDGPFIVENGAALYIPHGFLQQKPQGSVWQDGFWCCSFTSQKRYWLKLLERVKPEFESMFTHFDEMTIEEIQDATGLSALEAERASQRQYGEPVLWQSDEQSKSAFIAAVKERGAHPLEGGRFVHICGDCDKGRALKWLLAEYNRQFETDAQSIALGDGKNDIAMLEAADIAIRIASPTHEPPQVQKQQNVYTSTKFGPEGWTEMLSQLLSLED